MGRNKVEFDLSTGQAAAALDLLINKARQLEEALNKAAKQMGAGAASNPEFQSMLTDLGAVQGAIQQVRTLGGVSARTGIGITPDVMQGAIAAGGRAGASHVGDVMATGVANAQALISMTAAGPTLNPASIFGTPANMAATIIGSSVAVQGPTPAPAPPVPAAPAPPVAPVPAVVPVRGSMGGGRGAGTPLLMTPIGGRWGSLIGWGTALAAVNSSVGAMVQADVAEGGPLAQAVADQTRLLFGGGYADPRVVEGQMRAASTHGRAAATRAWGSALSWLPIGGDVIQGNLERAARDLDVRAAQQEGEGRGAMLRDRIAGWSGVDIGRAFGGERRLAIAQGLRAFGGAAAAGGVQDVAFTRMAAAYGESETIGALRSVVGQAFRPEGRTVRAAIRAGADVGTYARLAGAQMAASGDLSGLTDAYPLLGESFDPLAAIATRVLDAQEGARRYTARSSSRRSDLAARALTGTSVLSAGYMAGAGAVAGEMGKEAGAREDEYRAVVSATGAGSVQAQEARARWRGALADIASYRNSVFTAQGATIGARGELRSATRAVAATRASLYGGEGEIIAASRGRVADIDTEIGQVRGLLERGRGHLTEDQTLGYQTRVQSLLQMKTSAPGDLSAALISRAGATWSPAIAEAQSKLAIAALGSSDATVAASYTGSAAALSGALGAMRERLADPRVTVEQAASLRSEIAGLESQKAQSTAAAAAAQVSRFETRSATALAGSSATLSRAMRLGSGADVGAAVARQLGLIGERASGLRAALERGGLGFAEAQSVEQSIAGLSQRALDVEQAGIDRGMEVEDLQGYRTAQMRLGNVRRRLASSPYAPGLRFGVELEGIGMRRRRAGDLRARRAMLAASGNLSPDRAYEIESEMEALQTENVEAVASLAEGVENRLPALSAGRPARFSRMDSTQLAAFNLGRIGHPGRSMGATGGRQLATQDAFVRNLVGDLDIGPRSRTGGLSPMGSTSRVESILERILGAIERGAQQGSLRPGEARGRAGAALDGRGVLSGASGYN